ncbi:hypothetical protein L798_14855 [Zootermopsis nevadensis]|uniref:Uncharacterized protein n=1 Tax=Zootermopsis nevadensis TaxID=136037 RepID=A0A067QPH0_ZOONE|nr:hypothetical protein L798_14855 [Zootermopsis nevadensis]
MKGKFPDDDRLKDYCLCILGLMKLMKDNKFDPDTGLANLDKLPDNMREPLREAVTKCRNADQGYSVAREAAYAVVKCMYSAAPDNFLFP